jgi:hypothetical protein
MQQVKAKVLHGIAIDRPIPSGAKNILNPSLRMEVCLVFRHLFDQPGDCVPGKLISDDY